MWRDIVELVKSIPDLWENGIGFWIGLFSVFIYSISALLKSDPNWEWNHKNKMKDYEQKQDLIKHADILYDFINSLLISLLILFGLCAVIGLQNQ